MRFGFFFFAEYVNVFILSAMTTVLFLGGWNAPFDINPVLEFFGIATPVTIALAPGQLDMGLLWGLVIVAPVLVLILTAAVWMLRPGWNIIVSLIVGFILFNLLIGGLFIGWLAINLDWVIGLFWFLAKAIGLSAFFVLMRGTLPRVRIDELMGFAWKWLVPAALLNIFVTAGAILVIKEMNL
jgi:NADH:ubiquinone oxidoreductase subunit H